MIKVLHWIDDSVDKIRLELDYYRKQGYIVKEYISSKDFLLNYKSYENELIILDYFLSYEDSGLDLAKKLSTDIKYKNISIIVLSALLNVSTTRCFYETGIVKSVIEKSEPVILRKKIYDFFLDLTKKTNKKNFNKIFSNLTDKEKIVCNSIIECIDKHDLEDYTKLSLRNIRHYKTNIFKKFKVKDSKELLSLYNN